MLKFLVLTVFIVGMGAATHPIYVSICEINYNRDAQSLQMTQRIFIDDLEKAIRIQVGDPALEITLPKNKEVVTGMIANYVKNHFKMKVNDKDIAYTYLGHEFDGAATYCYMEITNVKKLKAISVTSTILLAEYDDQVNLVHVKVDGDTRSMKLSAGEITDRLSYE